MLARTMLSLHYRFFSKRVVKQHLIDDKIKQMLSKPMKNENSSEAESEADDFDDYRKKILSKANAAERIHNPQMNKSEQDAFNEQYFKMHKQYEKTVEDYFKNENLKVDPLHEHRIDKTRRLVRAIRVNNTFDFVREKNIDAITNEYNNYSKFQRNYSYFKENTKNEMLDEGDFNLNSKITQYTSKLAPFGEYEDSAEYNVRMAELEGRPVTQEMIDDVHNELESFEDQMYNEKQDTIESHEHLFGRLSPHAREDIYDMYNNGWTVNQISLKYGILPTRAKAIIWCKRYFYDEVAPVMGRTYWRLGIEREFMYAVKYPFVDYGLDLSVMAFFEKGISEVKYRPSPTDIDPPEEVVKAIQEKADRLKPVRVYTIERGTVGVGPKAYKIKDMAISGGSGKLDVSNMFKRICYRIDDSHSFPKKVRERLSQGPRVASYGYRVSPRQKRPIRFYNKQFHSL